MKNNKEEISASSSLTAIKWTFTSPIAPCRYHSYTIYDRDSPPSPEVFSEVSGPHNLWRGVWASSGGTEQRHSPAHLDILTGSRQEVLVRYASSQPLLRSFWKCLGEEMNARLEENGYRDNEERRRRSWNRIILSLLCKMIRNNAWFSSTLHCCHCCLSSGN